MTGEEEGDAGGGDTGEHGVGVHVHALDEVGNRSAPSDVLGAAAVGGDGLPRSGLIEVGKQRSRQGNGVGIDLRFGCRRDKGSGVGDDGGAAGVEEVLYAREVRVEGEGTSALRSIRSDGQQAGERVSESGSAGARLRERVVGVGVGGDDGAVAVVAALQKDADQSAIVRSAGSLSHGGEGVEPENKGAGVEARHRSQRCGAEKLAAGLLEFVGALTHDEGS